MKKYLLNITQTLLVLVALLSAGVAKAQDTATPSFSVTIPEFTVVAGQVTDVPVYFHSSIEVTGLQIDIKLPDYLQFAQTDNNGNKVDDGNNVNVWNESRFTNTKQSSLLSNYATSYNGDYTVNRAMVTNRRADGGIKASADVESDLIYTFKVELKDGATATDAYMEDFNFVENVAISVTRDDSQMYTIGYEDSKAQDIITTEETRLRTLTVAEPTGSLTFGEASYKVLPGQEIEVALNYDSDFDAHMIQFNLEFPTGLAPVDNSAVFASRTDADNWDGVFSPLGENKYIVVFDNMDTTASIDAGQGEFLRFKVAADATFAGGDIVISKIRASKYGYKYSIKSEDASVAVDNGMADARAAADAVVAEVEAALAAANEAVPTDVAEAEGVVAAKSAAQTAVDAYKAAIDAAEADNTLASNYDTVVTAGRTTADEAIAAIATTVTATQTENARVAANAAAAQADADVIAGLQGVLDEAIADVKANYFLGRDTQAEADLQAKIDALTAAVAAETARVAAEGEYASQTGTAADINAEIGAYVSAAQAKQEGGSENAQKLSDAQNVIKANQEKVDAAAAAVPEQYAADESVVDAIAAANAAVTAFAGAVDAASKDGSLVENYDAIIAENVAAVDAAIAKINEAVALKDANNAAIANDEARIKDLEEKLAAALAEAGENGDTSLAEGIAQQIADLKDSVSQAAASIEEGSAYVSPVDLAEEELAQQIEEYEAAAAATAGVRADNLAAYNEVLLSIQDVEETYQAALDKIASDYPNASVEDAKAEVVNAIAAAKAAAQEELDRAQADVDAFNYRFNAGPINVLITDLLNKAANDGVAVITADTVVEGQIFTLDGIRHAYPVQGKINIIRTKDSSKKVFVK